MPVKFLIRYTSRLFLMPLVVILYGHATVSAQNIQRCDVDQRLMESPYAMTQLAILEQHVASYLTETLQPRSTQTLPVVFHIVYFNPEYNISDIQIYSQIDVLNRDFAFASENLPGVPDEFAELGEDSGFRFCLAKSDPDGNPTIGITRTQTGRSNIGTLTVAGGRRALHYDIHGGKSGWDPDRYINIWVADLGGILGTATIPGTGEFSEEDGITIDPRYVGAVGLAAQSAPFHRGHTLTHEMGHYLGLLHVWGTGQGSCFVDDLIDDTPLQESAYTGCPQHPQISCGSADMFMNFMDYTNDRCLALFTKGQIARMQAILAMFRQELISSPLPCEPADNGKIPFHGLIWYYAPLSQQLIFALDRENTVPKTISIVAFDGRMVYQSVWHSGQSFWIDAAFLPSGAYAVTLESGGERRVGKFVVP